MKKRKMKAITTTMTMKMRKMMRSTTTIFLVRPAFVVCN